MKQGNMREQGSTVAAFWWRKEGAHQGLGVTKARGGLKGPSFSIFNGHRSPGGSRKCGSWRRGLGEA